MGQQSTHIHTNKKQIESIPTKNVVLQGIAQRQHTEQRVLLQKRDMEWQKQERFTSKEIGGRVKEEIESNVEKFIIIASTTI